MSVHHLEVSRIANIALSKANAGPHKKITVALEKAWDMVNYKRLLGDCGEDIASAEHYLFCRYFTAKMGALAVIAIKSAATVYDALKAMGITYREGTCAPSKLSPQQLEWREQGFWDGFKDHWGYNKLGTLKAPPVPNQSLLRKVILPLPELP